MKTLNKVQIVGFVGCEPHIQRLQNGILVAKFVIPTDSIWKDRKTKEIKKHTEWHTILLHGNLAEFTERFVCKGTLLYIEGALRTRTYKDSLAQERTITEIIAKDFMLLDKGKIARDENETILNEAIENEVESEYNA